MLHPTQYGPDMSWVYVEAPLAVVRACRDAHSERSITERSISGCGETDADQWLQARAQERVASVHEWE